MLERLKITNFKAWQELDMPFGKVTGLFGKNSSGKSSVLQFLLMLKQTKNATDRSLVLDFGGPDEFVNLGSFHDVIHRHHRQEWLDWQLDWKLPEELVIPNPERQRNDVLFRDDKLHTECRVGWRFGGYRAEYLRYRFDDTVFALESKVSTRFSKFDLTSDNESFRFVRTRGRPWLLPGPVKTRPPLIPRVISVSTMLAERAPATLPPPRSCPCKRPVRRMRYTRS